MFGATGIVTAHAGLGFSAPQAGTARVRRQRLPKTVRCQFKPRNFRHARVTACAELGWERPNRPEKTAGALSIAKRLVNVDVIVSEAETRRMCGVVVGSKKEQWV